jgi:hypothetical protein
MHPHDKANLKFLMTRTPEQMMNWMARASEDDIAYATQLIEAYRRELALSEYAEYSVEQVNSETATDKKFPQARKVLEKFTLKGLR